MIEGNGLTCAHDNVPHSRKEGKGRSSCPASISRLGLLFNDFRRCGTREECWANKELISRWLVEGGNEGGGDLFGEVSFLW